MKTKKVSKFLILLACCAMVLAFGSVSVSANDTVLTTAEVEGLTIPVAGANPDFIVSAPEGAPYTFSYYGDNMGNTLNVRWEYRYYDDNGDLITEALDADDTFEAGKGYYAEIIMQTYNGYSFAEDDLHVYYGDYEFDIDGYKGVSVILTAYFYVGTISEVAVTGLTLPAAGQKPDFSVAALAGEPYSVKNYMGEGWTNGMYWSDVTDPANEITLGQNDTFQAGHRYEVIVSVVPDKGYFFAGNENMEATIDHLYPEVNGGGEFVHLRYIFYVGDIDVIAVTDLKTPVAGKKVDYYVNIPKDANYHLENSDGEGWINDMIWTDLTTDKTMALNDTFIEGHTYRVLIGLMPNKGYEFNSELVGMIDGEVVDVRYPTFGARLEKVYTCKAAETPDYTNPFTDVNSTEYYCDPVLWAVDEGITTGTSKDTFSPMDGCTRAQAVTFLWRAAGKPEPKTAVNPFTDVKASDYYYKAVLWAVEQGITNGTSDTTFSPDANCIRPQIVTFLWRFAGEPDPLTAKVPFDDVKADAYFRDAVLWALENEITFGLSKTEFGTENKCLRGQIVTFLYRYIEE